MDNKALINRRFSIVKGDTFIV